MWRTVVILVVLAASISGCSQSGPAELSLEQVPDAIRRAFASARQALRTNAEGIAKLVIDGQYVAASLQLQALGGTPDLSEEQRSVLASATIAVNRKLQELASAPQSKTEPAATAPTDPALPQEEAAAAAAALEHHIRTK